MRDSDRLTNREMRNLRLAGRFRWLLPAVVAAVWSILLFSAWYRVSVILDRGAPHGISSFGEFYKLLDILPETTYNSFQVFAIVTANRIISDFQVLFMASILALVVHYQSRLTVKAWQFIQAAE